MKFITLLFIISNITTVVYAQKEMLHKTIAIPPRFDIESKTKPNAIPTVNPSDFSTLTPLEIDMPKVFDLKTKKSSTIQIGADNNSYMSVNNDFANPGDEYERKINKVKDRGDYKAFRKNQYLGDFISKAKYVRVMYRDYEYVDGDKIRVYVNGKMIIEEVTLIESFQGFDYTLESGFNKIEFEALNQGSSGPNTAEFRVYDDNGILISGNQWNLATGFKASIIIVKEVE